MPTTSPLLSVIVCCEVFLSLSGFPSSFASFLLLFEIFFSRKASKEKGKEKPFQALGLIQQNPHHLSKPGVASKHYSNNSREYKIDHREDGRIVISSNCLLYKIFEPEIVIKPSTAVSNTLSLS